MSISRKRKKIFANFSAIFINFLSIYLILSKNCFLPQEQHSQTATPAIFTIHLMAYNASSIANFFLFSSLFLSLLFNNAKPSFTCAARKLTHGVTVLIVNWLSISDTVRHTNESINGIMHMRSAGLVYRIEIRFIRSSKTPPFPL